MSNPKHTPGPWKGHEDGHISTADEASVSIAKVLGEEDSVFVSREQFEADIALISASPDLREALTKMWNFASIMVEKHDMNGDDTMTDEEHALWQEAGAHSNVALSKATRFR